MLLFACCLVGFCCFIFSLDSCSFLFTVLSVPIEGPVNPGVEELTVVGKVAQKLIAKGGYLGSE